MHSGVSLGAGRRMTSTREERALQRVEGTVGSQNAAETKLAYPGQGAGSPRLPTKAVVLQVF
jgi:hypothetical protein